MIRVLFPGRGPVFGLVVDGERVTAAAPIARYAVGWTAIRAVRYFVGRGCRVELVARGRVVRTYEP